MVRYDAAILIDVYSAPGISAESSLNCPLNSVRVKIVIAVNELFSLSNRAVFAAGRVGARGTSEFCKLNRVPITAVEKKCS